MKRHSDFPRILRKKILNNYRTVGHLGFNTTYNDSPGRECLQAEGPDGLRIHGSNGFQIHQIRNLRIFYGFGEILKIRIIL